VARVVIAELVIGVIAGLMQEWTGVFAEWMQGLHLYILGYLASIFSNSVSMLIATLGLSGYSNRYQATVTVICNNINVDVQNIYCGQAPQRDLMRFAYSMSHLINLCWPWKLTTEQSVLVNGLPCIIKLNRRIVKLSGVQGDSKGEQKYQKACCRL
jgi:hypothetical protein